MELPIVDLAAEPEAAPRLRGLSRRSKIALIWAAVIAAATAMVVAMAVAFATVAGSPALSPACKQAQAAEFAYARWVAGNTAYPNDSIVEGQAILTHAVALVDAMRKAGCPGTAETLSLPGG